MPASPGSLVEAGKAVRSQREQRNDKIDRGNRGRGNAGGGRRSRLHLGIVARRCDVPANGYIALVAGSVLTLAVGAGLIFLMYYSDREGFDDQPQVRTGNAEHRQQRPPGNA